VNVGLTPKKERNTDGGVGGSQSGGAGSFHRIKREVFGWYKDLDI